MLGGALAGFALMICCLPISVLAYVRKRRALGLTSRFRRIVDPLQSLRRIGPGAGIVVVLLMIAFFALTQVQSSGENAVYVVLSVCFLAVLVAIWSAIALATTWLGVIVDFDRRMLFFPDDGEYRGVREFSDVTQLVMPTRHAAVSIDDVTRLNREKGVYAIVHSKDDSFRLAFSDKRRRDELLAIIMDIRGDGQDPGEVLADYRE
jgi:hypothetical protein